MPYRSDRTGQKEPHPPFSGEKQRQPGLESKLYPRPRYQAFQYQEAHKLREKVALITGGDSGIGRAVAVLYAREGADVAISFLPRERSDALVTKRAVEAAGRRCVLLPGDVTSRRYCDAAVKLTMKELGRLDILVSNAAHQTRKKSLSAVSDREFDRTFKTNDRGIRVNAVAPGPVWTASQGPMDVKWTLTGSNRWSLY